MNRDKIVPAAGRPAPHGHQHTRLCRGPKSRVMAAKMAEEAASNSDFAGCTGRLEVICGCMFSGKTERLIERLRAAQREGQLVAAFKHMSDRRYSNRNLASHSHQEFPAEPVTSASEIRLQVGQF